MAQVHDDERNGGPNGGPNGVDALRRSIDELADAVEQAAPRDEVRRNLLMLAVGVLLIALVIVLSSAKARNDAQEAMAHDVTRCFLNAARADAATVAYCADKFDGYAQLRTTSAANARRFDTIIKVTCRQLAAIEPASDADAEFLADAREQLCPPPRSGP